MKKRYICASILTVLLLTTFYVPDIHGRWSLQTGASGCPQEIQLRSISYRSGMAMDEMTYATLYIRVGDQQVTPAYGLQELGDDRYFLYSGEKPIDAVTNYIPPKMTVRITVVGSTLLFQTDKNMSCKYRLKFDY